MLRRRHRVSTRHCILLLAHTDHLNTHSIGLMIAQAFAANGAKVYITSRTKEVLERSADVHSHGGDQKGEIIDAGVRQCKAV